jgi:iron complex transport system permease protein
LPAAAAAATLKAEQGMRISAGRLALLLGAAALGLLALGLSAGAEGLSIAWRDDWDLVRAIRAPRSLGALAAGALLGLAGAVAQGLFRNPLADPYLLGAAAGASLAVTLVLAATGGVALGFAAALVQIGIAAAAFAGALVGVMLTLLLARGAARPMVLLLCGVVVGVLFTALADLLVLVSPEALRGRQVFMLGTTSLVGWPAVGLMVLALAVVLPLAVALARSLDALVLGEATAASLGLAMPRLRLALVGVLAMATGTAVAQVGLVAFVGLIAPHLVRRSVVVDHRAGLPLSALAGAVLLLAADVLARCLLSPRELPVGLITAVLGGAFLLMLLRRGWR